MVWSPGSPLADLGGRAPAALLGDHPHLTVTAITPFGLEGPWRDRPATEFTLQAWSGGIIGLGPGAPDRAPVFVGGQVGEWLAGAYAAVGTMVAARPARTGTGEIVDVSMLEASALCLTYYPVTYFDALGRPFRSERSLVTPGVGPAKDGMVAVGCGTGQQWLDFCVMVGHPEWMEDKSVLFGERGHLAARSSRVVRRPHGRRDPGAGRRVPPPQRPDRQRRHHRRTRPLRGPGSFAPTPRRVPPARPAVPAPPDVLRAPRPAPRLGEHTGTWRDTGAAASTAAGGSAAGTRCRRGLRVLDMTAFWAGPSCTHILAMLGAEVIHLESTGPAGRHPDARGPMTEEQWWERSPIFSGLNTNKQSLTLDIRSEPAWTCCAG